MHRTRLHRHCCCTYTIVRDTILVAILIVLFSFRARLILSAAVALPTILRKYREESLPNENRLYRLRIKLDIIRRQTLALIT